MELPSKLLDSAVNEFARLPGVGRKTALRYVLHLLRNENEAATGLAQSIIRMKEHIRFCKECNNVSDSEMCGICSNPNRDKKMICVVQDVRDVMAIENTGQFKGVYHVLGGLISPMEGIGPADLYIDVLMTRAENNVQEVILALSATTEGDTTSFYLARKLQAIHIEISTLARGVPVGDELEYTDEVTLGRSLKNRVPYQKN